MSVVTSGRSAAAVCFVFMISIFLVVVIFVSAVRNCVDALVVIEFSSGLAVKVFFPRLIVTDDVFFLPL